MACDFKPGDDLVALDGGGDGPGPTLVVGTVYRCEDVTAYGPESECGKCGSSLGVHLTGYGLGVCSYCPCSFRKVERRNDSLSIEAFLTIKPGQFEEPKRDRSPAKKRERAQ